MSDQPNALKISTTPLASGHLVHIAGEVDLRTSPHLRNALLKFVEQKPKRLVIDLAHVTYMDSSGVGTMVEIKRLIEARGGRVVLADLQPRVRSVFEITQLDKFFDIVANANEADKP